MNHRRPIIQSTADAASMLAQLRGGAAHTANWLRSSNSEPLVLQKLLRFELVGHDPLIGEPLNVVEQLNQTFTTVWRTSQFIS